MDGIFVAFAVAVLVANLAGAYVENVSKQVSAKKKND